MVSFVGRPVEQHLPVGEQVLVHMSTGRKVKRVLREDCNGIYVRNKGSRLDCKVDPYLAQNGVLKLRAVYPVKAVVSSSEFLDSNETKKAGLKII